MYILFLKEETEFKIDIYFQYVKFILEMSFKISLEIYHTSGTTEHRTISRKLLKFTLFLVSLGLITLTLTFTSLKTKIEI